MKLRANEMLIWIRHIVNELSRTKRKCSVSAHTQSEWSVSEWRITTVNKYWKSVLNRVQMLQLTMIAIDNNSSSSRSSDNIKQLAVRGKRLWKIENYPLGRCHSTLCSLLSNVILGVCVCVWKYVSHIVWADASARCDQRRLWKRQKEHRMEGNGRDVWTIICFVHFKPTKLFVCACVFASNICRMPNNAHNK